MEQIKNNPNILKHVLKECEKDDKIYCLNKLFPHFSLNFKWDLVALKEFAKTCIILKLYDKKLNTKYIDEHINFNKILNVDYYKTLKGFFKTDKEILEQLILYV